jgi:hypothetical protein
MPVYVPKQKKLMPRNTRTWARRRLLNNALEDNISKYEEKASFESSEPAPFQ